MQRIINIIPTMKRIITSTIAATLCLFSLPAMAQDEQPNDVVNIVKRNVLHRYEYTFVHPTKKKWEKTAAEITAGCNTPYDKAKAIYRFLADNIIYDSSLSIYGPDEAWKEQKGVCQAYCNLFYHIGKAAGLDVRIIYGEAKFSAAVNATEKHSWIAVSRMPLDPENPNLMPEKVTYGTKEEFENPVIVSTKGMTVDNAILIDPTWGAGRLADKGFVINPNKWEWFDVDPHWMVMTHIPKSAEDQMLEKPVTREDFDKIPYITAQNYGECWSAEQCLERSISQQPFPTVYQPCSELASFSVLPIEPEMRIGKSYTVRMKKKKQAPLAIINEDMIEVEQDGNEVWKCEGDEVTINIVPQHEGELRICQRNLQDPTIFESLVSYHVPAPTAEEKEWIEESLPYSSELMKSFPAYDHDGAERLGISGKMVLEKIRKGEATGMPTFYSCPDFECKLIDIPLVSKLHSGTTYTFSFMPKGSGVWAIYHDGTFEKSWQIDTATGVHTMQFTPQAAGQCMLYVRPEDSGQYSGVIGYEVE